jgi:hypothetical protein
MVLPCTRHRLIPHIHTDMLVSVRVRVLVAGVSGCHWLHLLPKSWGALEAQAWLAMAHVSAVPCWRVQPFLCRGCGLATGSVTCASTNKVAAWHCCRGRLAEYGVSASA